MPRQPKKIQPKKMRVDLDWGLSYHATEPFSIMSGNVVQQIEGTPENVLAWATKVLTAALKELAKS